MNVRLLIELTEFIPHRNHDWVSANSIFICITKEIRYIFAYAILLLATAQKKHDRKTS